MTLGGTQARNAERHRDPMISESIDLAAPKGRTGGPALDSHAVGQ